METIPNRNKAGFCIAMGTGTSGYGGGVVRERSVESTHFAADWESAGAARRFVATTLARWGCEELEYVTTLLASELVANALLHAGTEIDVVIRQSEDCIRVEVHDRDHRLPTRKRYSITATTGRGLALVADLACDWRAEVTPEGKVVWFEVDLSGASDGGLLMSELGLDDWEDLAPESQLAESGGTSTGESEGGPGATRARGRPVLLGRW